MSLDGREGGVMFGGLTRQAFDGSIGAVDNVRAFKSEVLAPEKGPAPAGVGRCLARSCRHCVHWADTGALIESLGEEETF